MKIALADNAGLKFSSGIKETWENQGHEVKYERGASEHLAQWADIYWVDWADNNLAYLFKLYHGDTGVSRPNNWNNKKKPLVVCRAIDWELWTLAMHRDQSIVDWVDKWVCIAPHIEEKLRSETKFGKNKLKLIRPGLDLNKWTLKKSNTDGKQIGMVLGDMWWPKNHMGGLEIFNMLNDGWNLHIRGQHEGGEYWKIMYDHYIKTRKLEDSVTLYPHLANMNEWYENIDILLHPSMKETFCYAIAEAMAKGIRPVIYNFYGSDDIWPDKYKFNNHYQAVHMLQSPDTYDPMEFRSYIQDNYSLERMMEEINKYLGI